MLVERERELGALGRLVEAARSGAGGAVVVEGPAGIGKSSLLAAARDAAADEWEIAPAFCTWRPEAAPLLASLDRAEEALALAARSLRACS